MSTSVKSLILAFNSAALEVCTWDGTETLNDLRNLMKENHDPYQALLQGTIAIKSNSCSFNRAMTLYRALPAGVRRSDRVTNTYDMMCDSNCNNSDFWDEILNSYQDLCRYYQAETFSPSTLPCLTKPLEVTRFLFLHISGIDGIRRVGRKLSLNHTPFLGKVSTLLVSDMNTHWKMYDEAIRRRVISSFLWKEVRNATHSICSKVESGELGFCSLHLLLHVRAYVWDSRVASLYIENVCTYKDA